MIQKLEPVVLLLFVGVLVFAGLLLLSDRLFHDDAQIFQVLAGVESGFAGALFARIKPAEPGHSGVSVMDTSSGRIISAEAAADVQPSPPASK